MVPTPVSDLDQLLRSLEPALHDGIYVYSSVPAGTDLSGIEILGTFREAEGLSVIVREEEAQKAGLSILYRAAWITLTVPSDLEAVGLTAAFAGALGAAGISCNVVAGAYHDHLFVPVEKAEAAMAVLRALQAGAR